MDGRRFVLCDRPADIVYLYLMKSFITILIIIIIIEIMRLRQRWRGCVFFVPFAYGDTIKTKRKTRRTFRHHEMTPSCVANRRVSPTPAFTTPRCSAHSPVQSVCKQRQLCYLPSVRAGGRNVVVVVQHAYRIRFLPRSTRKMWRDFFFPQSIYIIRYCKWTGEPHIITHHIIFNVIIL